MGMIIAHQQAMTIIIMAHQQGIAMVMEAHQQAIIIVMDAAVLAPHCPIVGLAMLWMVAQCSLMNQSAQARIIIALMSTTPYLLIVQAMAHIRGIVLTPATGILQNHPVLGIVMDMVNNL